MMWFRADMWLSMGSATLTSVDQLISIVYVSSGVRLFEDAEIIDILGQARGNNEAAGLTGMLLYRDGNFLQVLEGPEPAVKATFQRIQQDERHRGIIVLKKTPLLERNFAEWEMAFRDVSGDGLKDVKGYSPFMELSFESNEFRSKPDFAYKMLLQFKDTLR